MTDLDWMLDGLCNQVDPEAFFPEMGATPEPGKKVCRKCPVIDTCLEYALAHKELHGTWGGLTERQRREIRLRGELVDVA